MSTITAADLDATSAWSRETFGPGTRLDGILDHLHKEIDEVREAPDDIEEWVDLILIAFDGAARQGFTGEEVIAAFHDKREKNRDRVWPDWRTADPDKAIEHVARLTLTYWSLPGSSRVMHGSKQCPSLTLNESRRARRQQREVPRYHLDTPGVPSTCGRCGNGLRLAILEEQRRRGASA